ncbi:coiled-coil domain-containing protein [Pseudobutyrivibrio xylanivorans]|uniref:Actin cytoskeleton-regulatory complex protein END3 n=1 Tax=Pseudobutyrivibrio xylanivorans DSM 14809 TaxID=1123012 RepID=A0A1M6I1Z7_PSEXY|nr:hypothetical protein [Pseudobutyrivibrio xylanivorans]SHJ28274.1 Actin cytoskeleton-regulatory complex protein END3 [Pseudobutyrivibrio xylanivorans DSM 14809]
MKTLEQINIENLDVEDIEEMKDMKKDKIRIMAIIIITILFLLFSTIAGIMKLRKTELVSGYQKDSLESFVKDTYADTINEKIGGDSNLTFDEITSIIARMISEELDKTNSFTGPQLSAVENLIEERISLAGPGTADPQVIKEITTVVEKQYETNYENMVDLHNHIQTVLNESTNQSDARYKELKEVDERILKWIESSGSDFDDKFRNRDGEIDELKRNVENLNKLLEEMKKAAPKQSSDKNESITELQNEIKNLLGAIEQLKAADDSKANSTYVDEKYAILKTEISTVNTNIKNLEQYLDGIKVDKLAIEEISEAINKLKGEMGQKADKSELSAKANKDVVDKLIVQHQRDFETLKNQLAALNTDITDLKDFKDKADKKFATKDELRNLSTQVGAIDVKFTEEYKELQQLIQELNTALKSKADSNDVNNKLAAVDETLQHLSDNDSNLMDRVKALEAAVKDTNKNDGVNVEQTDITVIKEDLQAMQESVDELKKLVNQKANQADFTTAINSLNEKDETLATSINDRKAEIIELSSRVDKIENRLLAVEGYRSDINSLIEDVNSIKKDFDNYYTKDEVNISIQNQFNKIQKITDEIQKLDSAAIQDIYKKIDELKGKVDTKADKADLDSKADKKALDSKADIKDLETKASKDDLAKKANISDLENKADKDDLKNKADKSDIEGLAKEEGNITTNNINNYINQDEKYTYTVSDYVVNGEVEHKLIITENR